MSDWWTQPSTPARQSAFASPARASASTSRARFVSDDPDPNSEAPKFLPSFAAASPVAKVALVSGPVDALAPSLARFRGVPQRARPSYRKSPFS